MRRLCSMPDAIVPLSKGDFAKNLPSPSITQGADGLPVVVERLEDPPIPPTEENLVCVAGCRHYRDWLIDSQDTGPGKELQRFCRAFATAEELMDISDGAVYACSEYAPPWWSPRGWQRKRAVRRKLRDARETILRTQLEILERDELRRGRLSDNADLDLDDLEI
jgi:hypothetical protein